MSTNHENNNEKRIRHEKNTFYFGKKNEMIIFLNVAFARVFDSFLFVKGIFVRSRYSTSESRPKTPPRSSPVHIRASSKTPGGENERSGTSVRPWLRPLSEAGFLQANTHRFLRVSEILLPPGRVFGFLAFAAA